MNKQIYVLFLLLISLGCSCTEHAQQKNETTSCIPIDFEELPEGNIFKDSEGNFDCELVQLQTTDESLIKYIRKAEIDEDCIFMWDMNKVIMVFDRKTGKYLRRIGAVGPGPKEYISLANFYLDRKHKEVVLYDSHKEELHRYDYLGNYKGRYLATYSMMGELGTIDCISDGNIICTMVNGPNSPYSYRIVDIVNSKITSEELPFCVVGITPMYYDAPQLAINSQDCYALGHLSDTIYRYNNGFVPCYLFNSGLKHRTNDCWTKKDDYEIGDELRSELRKKGYSTGLGELFIFGKYLHFTHVKNRKMYKIYWDTEKNIGYKDCSEYTLDFTKEVDTSNYLITSENELVTIYYGEEFVKILEKFPQNKQLEIIGKEELQDDNNPILVFYKVHAKYRG